MSAIDSLYIDTLISGVSYGMEVILSVVATYLIVKSGRPFVGRKLTLGYMACMVVLTTVWFITGARLTAYLLLEGEVPNGGECSAVILTTKVTAMLQILGSDVLLIYRTYIIWEKDWRVTFVLGTLYAATAVVGIMGELFCVMDINTAMLHDVFYIVTVTTNVLATAAIAWKLLRLRRSLRRSNKAHHSLTTRAGGVVLILAESAALYTILGVILIPTFWREDETASILGTAFTCLAFLNPAVVILHISMTVWMRGHSSSKILARSPHDTEKATMQDPLVTSPPSSRTSPIRGSDWIRKFEIVSIDEQLRSFSGRVDEV